MRTVINFTVRGRNKEDLHEKAKQAYQELMGDLNAELPFSATITISPDTTDTNLAGQSNNRSWIGEVAISLTAGRDDQ